MRHQAKIPEPRLPIYESAEAALANVTPMGNRVIVKRLKPEQHRTLVLASSEKSHWGVVLAKGPGKKTKAGVGPMEFEIGDKVLLGSFDDYPHLTAGDEEIIMVREGDILAVADGEA